ncbi:PREDICTED: BTB/POZ domain-containing protein DOT3 [Nelumbo nucifera]|uniref:BTB/POZ domain-containing protein DOT3 n=2 Tax=Nelumbo nucifera TaxID=4432 RepID=A0A1U8AUS2_NELNU|nr:PREDICTED: BTB/POZ domain-containing protein DOT3 [Nelumbo nucifera]DAD29112.1 TPA_asm: hypothetical protein HUJ06_030580 [Nelumbo nucifera]
MKKTLQRAHQMGSPRSDFDLGEHDLDQSIAIPAKFATIADSFEKKEQSWFVISQTPTDLTIKVADITFYAHKHPLVSRSGYMSRLNLQPSPNSNIKYDLKLDNFPGGPETFEIVLIFCYGLPVDLTPTNVAQLRCASEFLEMTEEYEDGNLIAKTEAFLTFMVFSSWRNTITVLKSCESLSPWAENLQIVRRCSDSIAWKVSRDNSTVGESIDDEGWWFTDVSSLRIDHFVRIITAIRAKRAKPEIVGACIMHYAEKQLPGMDIELEDQEGNGQGSMELQLGISNGRRQEGCIGHNKEQRLVIESLVSIVPPQKEAVSCKFLLWLLKMAMLYSVTPALVSELEKRVGMVLEEANAKDLLIPNLKRGDDGKFINSSSGECTMYNVDAIQRIVEYFLMHEQQQQEQQTCEKLVVGKLLDSYLAEIARDPNLSIAKFQFLAESMPTNTRTCDDGLYRAIDTYLKTHPSLAEHDRRRLCKLMNCEKLSLDACMHAAQNDRLPLRTVLQVLFSEQAKMRAAIEEKEPKPNMGIPEQESWSSTKEMRSMKEELHKVKTMMAELQRDYSELQQEFEKLNIKQRSLSRWSSKWKKLKSSTFFNEKMDGEETGETQESQNPVGCRVNCRRRLSMS